ncbi:MAG: FAD-linked oxidase C-terminal domain-containing protein, partial [Deferribacterota bacterium]|nr:FAD-linked oxidase C-terminal domain-containing protein [Deferribacterota bacterium]
HTFFTGSEGTLGIVTKLKFKLIDKPSYDTLLVAYFNDIFSSTKAVNLGLQFKPSGIEIMDKSLLRLAKATDETLANNISEDADNVLLFEFDGYSKEAVINEAKKVYDLIIKNKLTDNIYLATSKKEQDNFRAIRKAAVPILYKLKGDKKIVALVEDAAIPPTKLDKYFEGIYQIFNRHLVDFVIYGHIAKGLLHTRPLLNLKSAEDVRLLKIIADEFFDLIYSLGGTISGEHGDGRIRSYYVKLQYPKIYHLFKQVKNILDQKNIFNPLLKLTDDEYLISKDLRYGITYKAKDIFNKNLLWLEDFLSETEKCHGCSKCTTIDTSVRMCPVYKFTRDERATPKAKANILRALISGVIDDSEIYKSELQKVMNLCIGCESCHFECPSNVNIPKLAAEAKSQYYRKFSIPLNYRLITKIDTIAKWTHKFAKISDFVTKYYYVRKAFEPIIHVSPQRRYPSISTKSLFDQVNNFEGRGEKKVLFFAGCYYSYFEPAVGLKTVEILKNIGFTVITPRQYCCGVPMIPKGMANAAKERIYKNLESWGNLIDDVDNIVVSCSSCGLALMSEWGNFINNSRVNKIKDKTIHITKLLDRYKDYLYIEDSSIKAYHIPCHLKVQKDSDATANLINNLDKNNLKVLDSNCCGMAGSWGLLSDNYSLSSKIGKDLDDKIKESECSIVITDCPTCRMQIKDLSNVKVLHPVELIKVK